MSGDKAGNTPSAEVERNMKAFMLTSNMTNLVKDSSKIKSLNQIVMSPTDVDHVAIEDDVYTHLTQSQKEKIKLEIKKMTKEYYSDFYNTVHNMLIFLQASGLIFLDLSRENKVTTSKGDIDIKKIKHWK
ncbi:hypothetical protein [Piscirickettsia litoralis]|uniref:Uncharacterized protein n=1 Tax=Piscirickettsia litoralis TaxID=1891921 RepID=A0ABX2ZZI7_9GAMM|nr:hypothetical protein [Piscirickettsia litoralis]ODN41640.1 hypothetical protein BGC07_16230 [Piscirickettsia litoralis]